jgi:hypothetical protein
MEAAQSVPGTVAIGRASRLRDWNLTPADLKKWGAAWADYSLSNLPEALTEVEARPARKQGRRAAARRKPR